MVDALGHWAGMAYIVVRVRIFFVALVSFDVLGLVLVMTPPLKYGTVAATRAEQSRAMGCESHVRNVGRMTFVGPEFGPALR